MAKRSREHQLAQKIGKEIGGYRCVFCGEEIMPEEAEGLHRIEGHHIIEHHVGGPAYEQNIIPLCHDCHEAYHQGKIKVNISRF